MSDTKEYVIKGEVVAKGRPRFTKTGRVYTPKKTKRYEELIRYILRSEGAKPTNKPVALEIIVHRQYLKSWSAKQIAEAKKTTIYAPTRPDLDNYIKTALDACNGLLFDDDNQVVKIKAKKIYGEEDKLIIRLTEME